MYELLERTFGILFQDAHILTISFVTELVVNHIFHEMSRLNLTETDKRDTQASIREVVFARS